MATKYEVERGCRWPKSKELRDAIAAGEATSADVPDNGWKRVKQGSRNVTCPDDVAGPNHGRGLVGRFSG